MQKKRVAVIAKRSNLQLATLRKADGWRLPRRFAPRHDALLSGHHAIASPCLWTGGGSIMKFLDGFGEQAYALLSIVAGDRKRVMQGKRVSGRVQLGGRRII